MPRAERVERLTPRAPRRPAAPRRTGARRAADRRCGAASSRSTARGARQVRAGRARQVAADRVGQRAPPVAAAELVGERGHGARVGGAERVARIARRGGEQQRAAHRTAQLVLVDARRSRSGAPAAAGPPGSAHSLSGYEARARSMSRSSVTDAQHLDTRGSRLAALLMRPPRPSVADSGVTGSLPRSRRFPVFGRPSGRARGRAVVAHRLLEGLDDRRVELRAGVAAQLRRARPPCCARRGRGGRRPSRRTRRRPR